MTLKTCRDPMALIGNKAGTKWDKAGTRQRHLWEGSGLSREQKAPDREQKKQHIVPAENPLFMPYTAPNGTREQKEQ